MKTFQGTIRTPRAAQAVTKKTSAATASVISAAGTGSASYALEAAHATEADHALEAETAAKAETAAEAAHAKEADRATEASRALEADRATEAGHAEAADTLTDLTPLDGRYISKTAADTAQGLITFAKGLTAEGGIIADGGVRSSSYQSGTPVGSGFALTEQTAADGVRRSYLEVDCLTVRQTMQVTELRTERIRSICGSLGITQATGRVKAAALYADAGSGNAYWRLEMEGSEGRGYGGFQKGDFIRCQRYDGTAVRGYWAQVSDVQWGGRYVYFWASQLDGSISLADGMDSVEAAAEADVTDQTGEAIVRASVPGGMRNVTVMSAAAGIGTMSQPQAGDEVVQFGSATDTARQAAIYLHFTAQGQPCISLLEGVKSRSFEGCLRLRIGAQTGGGFGVYIKNGTIIATDQAGAEKVVIDPTAGTYKFEGEVQAASGTFTGEVHATGGTFTGEVHATGGTFQGEIKAATGTFNGITSGFTASSVCTVTKDNFWAFFEMFSPAQGVDPSKDYIRPRRGNIGRVYVFISAPDDALCQYTGGGNYLNLWLPPYQGQSDWRALSLTGQSFTFIPLYDGTGAKGDIGCLHLHTPNVFAADPDGEFDKDPTPVTGYGDKCWTTDCGFLAEYQAQPVRATYDDTGKRILQMAWTCRRNVYCPFNIWDYENPQGGDYITLADVPQQFITW